MIYFKRRPLAIFSLIGKILILRMRNTRINVGTATALEPIRFDFKDSDLHQGFVNSKSNPGGLQADFFSVSNGESVACTWSNTDGKFQGFPGIIHGGILSSLCDELMANAVLAKERKFAMTLEARFSWKKPAYIGDVLSGSAAISASLFSFRLVEAEIRNSKGKVLLVGSALFYLPTWEVFNRALGVKVPEEIRPYLR